MRRSKRLNKVKAEVTSKDIKGPAVTGFAGGTKTIKSSKNVVQIKQEIKTDGSETLKPNTCHICSKSYSKAIYMRAHIRRFHNRKCPICLKTLSSVYKMEQHMRTVHADISTKKIQGTNPEEQLYPWGDKRNSKCPVCCKQFDRPYKMERHWRSFHNRVFVDDTAKRTCPICSKSFQYKYRMERHRLIHDRDDTIKKTCPVCGKIFSKISLMTAHKRSQHENVGSLEERTCHICQKVHKTYRLKNEHIKNQHTVEPVEKRTCSICSTVYANIKGLMAHKLRFHSNKTPKTMTLLTTHNEENNPIEIKKASKALSNKNNIEYRKCPICNKTFGSGVMFRNHFRAVHPGKMPFECKVCCKRFKFKISFHNHLKSGKKCQSVLRLEYRKCPICYKLHDNPIFLKGHMGTTHKGATPPFHCTNCEVNFIFFDALENHLFNESPKCKSKAQLARLETYKKMIRNGINNTRDTQVELEYRRCAVCFNVHAHEAALNTHMTKRHRDVKPFVCTVCNKSFKRLKEFENHVLEVSSKCNNDKQAAEILKYKDAIKNGRKVETKGDLKGLEYHKCPVCFAVYTQKKTLRRHMLKHKNVEPFICGCKRKFQHFEDFENHVLEDESPKCNFKKQKEKLRMHRNAIKNGIYDKNMKNNDISDEKIKSKKQLMY